MLSYAKLWTLLESKGMKRTDLKQIISSATLAKLGKNEPINSTVIEKLCAFLNCQPGDIMEYVSEKTLDEMVTQLDIATRTMMNALKEKGISEEQFTAMLIQEIPNYFKSLSNDENPSSAALSKHQNNKENV